MITISVPSKVHLLGEYAVVYGKPALLAAINKRIIVTIIPSQINQIQGVELYKKQVKQLLEILGKQIQKQLKFKKINAYSMLGRYWNYWCIFIICSFQELFYLVVIF